MQYKVLNEYIKRTGTLKYTPEEFFFVKNAGILDTIKEYIGSKGTSVSSILAFIGPGLLTVIGFPKIGLLVEVMRILGFDWEGFWDKVKNFVSDLISGDKKQINSSEIQSNIQDAVSSSFTGEPDTNKLNVLMKQNNIRYNPFIKNASMFQMRFGGILSKIIYSVIKVLLISLGFDIAGAGVSHLLGTDKKDDVQQSASAPSFQQQDIIPASFISNTPAPPNTPEDLLEHHPNNMSSVWIEHFNISELSQQLIQWTIEAYPELKGHETQIQENSTFQKIISLFQKKNSLASNLEIVSIPAPFERKIDIINMFAPQVIKEIGNTANL